MFLKKIIICVLCVTLLIMSTATAFADDGISKSPDNILSVDTLSEGDTIDGVLKVGEQTIVPFEQGSYWKYGGSVQYSKYFETVTRSILLGFCTSLLTGAPIGSINAAVNAILTGATSIDDAMILIKETCTYRETANSQYEHHHIVEYYKNGSFAYSDDYTYYDISLHGWPK